jgi:hypothetical protein
MKIINSCSDSFKEFFNWSKEYLKENDKKIIIKNTNFLRSDGVRCGGLCYEDKIVMAFKNPLFEEIYVHEFSHMQQKIEGSKLWEYDSSFFWNSLAKNKTEINCWENVLGIIALERDCEKRALKHSKKWNLFNNEEYIKRTNLYLCFYQYVFLKRKWPNSTTIYIPDLIELMPKKLLPLSYFNKIDMELMKAFDYHIEKSKK